MRKFQLSIANPTRPALESVFDRRGYQRLRPDLAAAGMDALDHYLAHGWSEGVVAHPLFDAGYYLGWNPDAAGAAPLAHYVAAGEAQGAWPSAGFDSQFYARRAGLAGPSGALAHYIAVGAAAGLDPHPLIPAGLLASRAGRPAWTGLADHLTAAREGERPLFAAAKPPAAAVVAHVFYPDLWPEMAERLRLLPEGVDVFVTHPKDDAALATRIARELPAARLRPQPNRGRDIAPFLAVLPELLAAGYAAVGKVHTKRGATEPDAWRYMMLEALLPDAASVSAFTAAFRAEPALSVIGPLPFHLEGDRFMAGNGDRLAALAAEVGLEPEPASPWGFFAGSMFWARAEALRPLLRAMPDFAGDNLANDGLDAHALERLFGRLLSAPGARVGVIARSGDRTLPRDLAFRDAPGPRIWEELADSLPAAAAKLAIPLRKLALRRGRATTAPDTGGELGVTLVGPVEAQHGLGVSARGYAQAVMGSGLPLHVIAWRPGFDRVRHVPVDMPYAPGQPLNLLHLNLDLLHTAKLLDAPPIDALRHGRINIGIASWELVATLPEWADVMDRLDEIWVGSEFTRRAFSAVTRTPVHVVRPTITPPHAGTSDVRRRLGLPKDRRLFFYSADLGSLSARKNPEALWRAYAEAFAPNDGAACVLKLHYADPDGAAVRGLRAQAEGREDMLLMTRSLSGEDMQALFADIDVYVSPHRSEGVGLTVVEAMMAGKPVVATRFGGVEDFVDETTAFCPRHRLIEVGPGAAPYPAGAVWADPDVGDLAAQMRRAFDDREEVARRSRAARERVEALFGATATAWAIGDGLRRAWRERGGRA